MADERLDGASAEAFIAGAVALARTAVATPTWFELALKSLEAAYAEQPQMPAPTLALDLTVLLQGERLAPLTVTPPPRLADAMRGYEDHVLARLVADRRFTLLVEAMSALDKPLRPAAVGLMTAQLCSRLKGVRGTGVPSAVVRRFATRPAAEAIATGRTELFVTEVADQLAEGLELVVQAARKTRELITDAEVFLLENLSALRGLAARVALGQLAEVAQRLEERLPTRVRGSIFDDGHAPTSIEEESAFPVGGFSSVSTQGSVENLLSSELIYMEQAERGGDVESLRPDLFDVRFVENELLYYARDESVAVRRRRRVCLVLDPSLSTARVKDAGEGFQRLVWALGAVTAVVRTLARWFGSEALRFEVVFARAGADAPLSEEAGVLGLILREFRERGQVEVRDGGETLSIVEELTTRFGSIARTFVVTAKLPSGMEGPRAPEALVLLNHAKPSVLWREGPSSEAPLEPEPALEAWVRVSRSILDGLLHRR